VDVNMPRASNGDVSLYYDVAGPSEAPTVVFVEGLAYGRWMWRFQRERFSEYRTVLWDNRGTGDSDSAGPGWLLRRLPAWKGIRALAILKLGGYTIAEMAADLEAVLDAVGVDRVHLVGASMGGMIAQEYAIEYDRAETVGLFCTTHGGEQAVPIPEETRERMYESPEGYDERELIEHRMAPAMTDSFRRERRDLVEDILDWRTESDADEPERWAQSAAVLGYDSTSKLDRLTQPTFVAHGTDDRVLPIENGRQLYRRLPNAEFEPFEGGSHLFFIEEADTVTDRLRRFFETHTDADAVPTGEA
jgi:pimeloyl-ACP methyl ester carboxylesterase